MIRALKALTSRQFQQYLLLLLIPGLSFKRWLGVGILGLAFITLGVIFSLKISTGPAFISVIESISLRNESPAIRGSIFIVIGLLGTAIAGFGLNRSLGNVGHRTRHWPILDSLYVERVLSSGPKIAVIGGGSGLPNLIRGLKNYTSNISAVVTVADDGGSSGRLRTELGILPPGDIRNCLVALADSEEIMQQLMDYRFESEGQLNGHNFGNILIAALAGIRGDFYRGVEVVGKLLAIRGRVLVGQSSTRLRSLSLIPAEPEAHPEAIRAIEDADMVVIGPGSLFTSIVPNLLITDIATALINSQALKIYVCNVAEEPAQTEGYSVLEHLNIVRHYGGTASVDAVIANINVPEGPTPAGLDFIRINKTWAEDVILIKANVIDDSARSSAARHDSNKLANVIAEAYRKYRGPRRRLPRVRLYVNRMRQDRN